MSLLRADGKPLPRQKVSLQQRTGRSRTWRTLGSRTTSGSADVSFRVTAKRGTQYRWIYGGSAAFARSVSAVVQVRR